MIPRKSDLAKTFLGQSLITGIFLRNGRKTYDRIHGCTDIVRHGGEEISLGLIGLLCLVGRDLKTSVNILHVEHVADKQYQQCD